MRRQIKSMKEQLQAVVHNQVLDAAIVQRGSQLSSMTGPAQTNTARQFMSRSQTAFNEKPFVLMEQNGENQAAKPTCRAIPLPKRRKLKYKDNSNTLKATENRLRAVPLIQMPQARFQSQ